MTATAELDRPDRSDGPPRHGTQALQQGGYGRVAGLYLEGSTGEQFSSEQFSGEQFTDDELTALALAAGPDEVVPDDAVPLYLAGPAHSCGLPVSYMPPVMAGKARGWRVPVIVILVAAFLLVDAFGLCITYGQLVAA